MNKNPQIFSAISRHLIKTSRLNCISFCTALSDLLSSHKPSILFDFGSATPSQLTKIVEDSRVTPSGRVKVVKLLDDVVLVDTQHDFLSSYTPVFVDCSMKLKEPIIAETKVVQKYMQLFGKMLETVQSSSSPTFIDLDSLCNEGVCLTTIFGMFLQYPYVYYTADQGNCLSGVQLVVVELGLVTQQSSHTFTSFSIPESLLSDEKELEKLEHYVGHRTVCLNAVAM